VRFWRDEVRKESDLASKESADLQRAIGSLERALRETGAPLKIAEECLQLRREKIAGELVHDEVERELIQVL
jgi:tektin-3